MTINKQKNLFKLIKSKIKLVKHLYRRIGRRKEWLNTFTKVYLFIPSKKKTILFIYSFGYITSIELSNFNA